MMSYTYLYGQIRQSILRKNPAERVGAFVGPKGLNQLLLETKGFGNNFWKERFYDSLGRRLLTVNRIKKKYVFSVVNQNITFERGRRRMAIC